MDERHLIAAARYVERNPVRAHLCERPEDWEWSNARAHLAGDDDELVRVEPLLELISDWRRFLGETETADLAEALHAHASTRRPLGGDDFVEVLEQRLGRPRRWSRPSLEDEIPWGSRTASVSPRTDAIWV
jgi:putative transposase